MPAWAGVRPALAGLPAACARTLADLPALLPRAVPPPPPYTPAEVAAVRARGGAAWDCYQAAQAAHAQAAAENAGLLAQLARAWAFYGPGSAEAARIALHAAQAWPEAGDLALAWRRAHAEHEGAACGPLCPFCEIGAAR